MLCENCKTNEATIHYTEIINNDKSEHHICLECAKKLNLPGIMNSAENEFPFVSLLKGILSAKATSSALEDSPMMHISCPVCGMSFDEFTTVGKFGCSECYGVFGPLIEDNMKRIHGGSSHKGKTYRQKQSLPIMDALDDDPNVKINELKEQLKRAVALEDFEEAARLRDLIKAAERIKNEDEYED